MSKQVYIWEFISEFICLVKFYYLIFKYQLIIYLINGTKLNAKKELKNCIYWN